ncbi:MAG TPA: hypothetical protein VK771_04135, partial [Acidimicrobiia bacterium]|nr:hypothetical protein [Acidimicrobiia bacterium]
MRRLPPVRLAAPPEAVRAAAVAHLGAVPQDDLTLRVGVADRALTDVAVDLLIVADGADATVVTFEPHGQLEIP